VKKRRLQSDVDALKKSADTYADEAESKANVTLITKSNCMRRSAKEKASELALCKITEKEMELKNS
jgi:hypothetical protein